jgi:hypothetical protein
MPLSLATWGLRLYFPFEGSLATDFIALKNPPLSAGYETTNLGSSGKHDSHYSTKNDCHIVSFRLTISQITHDIERNSEIALF